MKKINKLICRTHDKENRKIDSRGASLKTWTIILSRTTRRMQSRSLWTSCGHYGRNDALPITKNPTKMNTINSRPGGEIATAFGFYSRWLYVVWTSAACCRFPLLEFIPYAWRRPSLKLSQLKQLTLPTNTTIARPNGLWLPGVYAATAWRWNRYGFRVLFPLTICRVDIRCLLSISIGGIYSLCVATSKYWQKNQHFPNKANRTDTNKNI
jgi:hypothetical protein